MPPDFAGSHTGQGCRARFQPPELLKARLPDKFRPTVPSHLERTIRLIPSRRAGAEKSTPDATGTGPSPGINASRAKIEQSSWERTSGGRAIRKIPRLPETNPDAVFSRRPAGKFLRLQRMDDTRAPKLRRQ